MEPFVFLMEDEHKTAVLDSLKNTNTFAIPRYQTGLCVRFAMRNTQQCRRGLFVTGSNTLTHNGECPWETRIHKTRLSKVMRGFRTADDDVKNRVVLEIFEENPEYFLDEFVREFGIRTGRHLLSDAFWSTMGFLYRYVMMLQNIAMMKHELNTLQHCVNSLQIQIS